MNEEKTPELEEMHFNCPRCKGSGPVRSPLIMDTSALAGGSLNPRKVAVMCEWCGASLELIHATVGGQIKPPDMRLLDQQFKFVHAAFACVPPHFDPAQYPNVLHVVMTAFARNCDRAIWIARCAFYVAGRSLYEQKLMYDILVERNETAGRRMDWDVEFQKEVLREVRSRLVDRLQLPGIHLEMQYFSQLQVDHVISNSDGISVALAPVMASQITAAWTAFETLYTDLWVTCVNARPRLAFKAMDAEPAPGDTEDEADKKRKKRFPIPQFILDDSRFDLHDRMGTVLVETKKWDFGRRDQAADAYRKVFSDPEERLTKVFRSESLQWLAALRNVLIHRAGIADREFTKLVRGHPKLSAVDENQLIPLDGDITAEMLSTAVDSGAELIAFARDWLNANPH